jgi:hypothetical protein
MLVEPDRRLGQALRLVLEWNGFGEPLVAEDAEEALDLLGAKAQAFDLLLMAYGPIEPVDVSLIRVLRRIRSPLRLALYGPLEPEELLDAAALTGAAAYIDLAGLTRIAGQIRELLAAPFTVQHIIENARAPTTMSRRWVLAIYGTEPGHAFARARLDHIDQELH